MLIVNECDTHHTKVAKMGKLMLVMLVAAMAAPAMATVTISVSDNGDATADINYFCDGGDAAGTKALMAGLAIIITVDAGDTIIAVVPARDGESTAGAPGYGVFMKTAQIDMADPCAPVWAPPGTASPIADPGDPGTVGGIGQYQITLELGALYDDPCNDMANAPLASGTLCTITVDDGDASNDSVVTLALEDVSRGGVVMEGGGDPCSVILAGEYELFFEVVEPECLGSGHAAYAEWLAAGSPKCWCNTYHCYGDGDGAEEGSVRGGYYWVSYTDLSLIAANWQLDSGETAAAGDYPTSANGICADYARNEEGSVRGGYYRISYSDLSVVAANWQASTTDTSASGDDPYPHNCGGTFFGITMP